MMEFVFGSAGWVPRTFWPATCAAAFVAVLASKPPAQQLHSWWRLVAVASIVATAGCLLIALPDLRADRLMVREVIAQTALGLTVPVASAAVAMMLSRT